MASTKYVEDICRILELPPQDLQPIGNSQSSIEEERTTPRCSNKATNNFAYGLRVEFARFAIAHLIHIEVVERWKADSFVTMDAVLDRDADGTFLALDPAYVFGFTETVVRRAQAALEAAAASRRQSQTVSASTQITAKPLSGSITCAAAVNPEEDVRELAAQLRVLRESYADIESKYEASQRQLLLVMREHARTEYARAVQLEATEEFLAPIVQQRQREWQTQHEAWLVKQKEARDERRRQEQARHTQIQFEAQKRQEQLRQAEISEQRIREQIEQFTVRMSPAAHSTHVTVAADGLSATGPPLKWSHIRGDLPIPPRYAMSVSTPLVVCIHVGYGPAKLSETVFSSSLSRSLFFFFSLFPSLSLCLYSLSMCVFARLCSSM